MVKLCPLQILPLLALIVGTGFTVMLVTAVLELTQPAALVPVIE
jgi:hypothetical protein